MQLPAVLHYKKEVYVQAREPKEMSISSFLPSHCFVYGFKWWLTIISFWNISYHEVKIVVSSLELDMDIPQVWTVLPTPSPVHSHTKSPPLSSHSDCSLICFLSQWTKVTIIPLNSSDFTLLLWTQESKPPGGKCSPWWRCEEAIWNIPAPKDATGRNQGTQLTSREAQRCGARPGSPPTEAPVCMKKRQGKTSVLCSTSWRTKSWA